MSLQNKNAFKAKNQKPIVTDEYEEVFISILTWMRMLTDMMLMSLMLWTGCSQDPSVTTYLYLIWCFNARTSH